MTRICFHPASLRASESNVYLHTCVHIFVWLRQYSLRASLSGLAPFSRVVRPESASWIFAFRRSCIPFRNSSNFCIPSPDFTWGVHFVQPRQNPLLGFPYRSLLPWTSLRCRPLRTRSPGFASLTRTWSLFTDIGIFSCQLFYRDAIFFSSPQLAKKRRQIRYFFLALLAPYLERA